MKKIKIYLVGIITLFTTAISAQTICYNYGGSWSSWTQIYNIAKYTDQSGFVFKTSGGIEYFSFTIHQYVPPTKAEKKAHLKSKQWFEYYGTVEYYVNDTYPTASHIAKKCMLVQPDPRYDQTPVVKRTAAARIKIAPYKHIPQTYNIWFDNIGIGIDVTGLKFEGDKPRHKGGRIIANIAQSIFLFPFGIGSW